MLLREEEPISPFLSRFHLFLPSIFPSLPKEEDWLFAPSKKGGTNKKETENFGEGKKAEKYD